MKLKGKVCVYKYDNEKDGRIEYVMIDHSVPLVTPEDFHILCPAVMGFCAMSKLEGWVAVETAILYVSPLWRRRGVAQTLYDTMLRDGQIIISGWCHNPKSYNLWKKMVMNPNYVVWAQDMKNTDRQSDVWVDDDGEYVCNLKLYNDIKKKSRKMKEDIRFVAINPRHV